MTRPMRSLPQFARFWMICRKPTGPGSRTAPVQRYSSITDAVADARRLATQTGAQFLVLETVGVVDPGGAGQEALDI